MPLFVCIKPSQLFFWSTLNLFVYCKKSEFPKFFRKICFGILFLINIFLRNVIYYCNPEFQEFGLLKNLCLLQKSEYLRFFRRLRVGFVFWIDDVLWDITFCQFEKVDFKIFVYCTVSIFEFLESYTIMFHPRSIGFLIYHISSKNI